MKHITGTTIALRAKLLVGISLPAAIGGATATYAQQATTPVPDISVNAKATEPLMDGSAAAGYRVKNSTGAGPIWGDLPLQDTPYSITVVPSELIENLQAYQPEQIAKVVPQISNVQPQQNATGNPFFVIRGFRLSQFTNNAGVTYDGVQGGVGGFLDTVLEDKERVEVLSGVNGFLYGTGSVGGNINYVLKRPTETPIANITAGNNSGGNGYIHGDFSGPLKIPGVADGLIGYRLNIVGQDGSTSLDGQSIKRNLISGAIDVHLMDNMLLQFNAEHSNYHVFGVTPAYTTPATLQYPAPPNPASVVTNSWAQFVDNTDTAGVKLTWKLNDIFTVRTTYDYTRENRPLFDNYATAITNAQGSFTTSDNGSNASNQYYTNGGYSFLDAEFSTFGIRHKMTTGFTGFVQLQGQGTETVTVTGNSVTQSLYNQMPLPPPTKAVHGTQPGFITTRIFAKNYVLGDEIKITDQFTILAGGNYTSLGNEGFNSSGLGTSGYGRSALTPTASLIYKPLTWLTAYTTYQQSLQSGTQVLSSGSTVFTNNGAILPPTLGSQYEVGAKATVAENLLLTLALFDIDKANQFNQQNPDGTFTALQSGREIHKGAEVTAMGKVWDDLTVIGGFTAMDARITNAPATPWQNGFQAQFVSPFSEKIYVEYNIPFLSSMPLLQGLTLIAGMQYASSFYQTLPTSFTTIQNAKRLPAYTTGDLGFRYTTKFYDKPFILRFNVNNVGNTHYWTPGGFVGLPRTYLATAEMQF